MKGTLVDATFLQTLSVEKQIPGHYMEGFQLKIKITCRYMSSIIKLPVNNN
jgi:hypothetical protein